MERSSIRNTFLWSNVFSFLSSVSFQQKLFLLKHFSLISTLFTHSHKQDYIHLCCVFWMLCCFSVLCFKILMTLICSKIRCSCKSQGCCLQYVLRNLLCIMQLWFLQYRLQYAFPTLKFSLYIFHSENSSTDQKRWGSDEITEGKDKSLQPEIVLAPDSSIQREENGNSLAASKNKGNIRENIFAGILSSP